jgi:hypothetical protein
MVNTSKNYFWALGRHNFETKGHRLEDVVRHRKLLMIPSISSWLSVTRRGTASEVEGT